MGTDWDMGGEVPCAHVFIPRFPWHRERWNFSNVTLLTLDGTPTACCLRRPLSNLHVFWKLGGKGEIQLISELLLIAGLGTELTKICINRVHFSTREGCAAASLIGFSWWLTAFDYDSNFIWLDCFSLLFSFSHQSSFSSAESPAEQQSLWTSLLAPLSQPSLVMIGHSW